MNGSKGQNLPIMNAIFVSVTLHAMAGWLFLNIARDMTNRGIVPPIEFFVVQPPPEHAAPVSSPAIAKQTSKKVVAPLRQLLSQTPVMATKPAKETPVAPNQPKQRVETAQPPSPVPLIAASLRAKEPSVHVAGPTATAGTAVPSASNKSVAARGAIVAGNDAGTITGPSYGAAYLHNPSPPYPPIAHKLRLQGTPVVRVLVSPEGQPENVFLGKTSGVRVLDDAAVEAVKRWTFVPARRGNNRIAAWVDVPIHFHPE